MAKRSPESRGNLGHGERDVLTDADRVRLTRSISEQVYPAGKRGRLSILPSGSLGGKDSAHDVYFAEDQVGAGGVVAIKRFRRLESAEHELAAMAEIGERGLKTFQAVGKGIYDGGNLGYALVTERMPGLTTMNQIGWRDARPGEPDYEDYATTLRSMATYAGELHAAGVAHGDFQIKNIGAASTVTGSEFVTFDVEGVTFSDSAEDFAFDGKRIEDLTKMTRTLVSAGFLANATPVVFEEELTANVLEPYWDANPSGMVIEQWPAVMAVAELERPRPGTTAGAAGYLALSQV